MTGDDDVKAQFKELEEDDCCVRKSWYIRKHDVPPHQEYNLKKSICMKYGLILLWSL